MSRGQKVITFALWGLLFAAMAFVVAMKFWPRHKPSDLPVLWPAAQFSLVDQDGKAFSTQDLRGRPWVAGYVFTNCAGLCPRLTATMAQLQKQVPADVHMVSFSVDPENDTPEVLKKYAATHKADESRWHFLTGPKDQVVQLVADMKMPYGETKSPDEPILHSDKLTLIDADGNVREHYDSKDPEKVKKLAADAEALAREARSGGGGRKS
jgi:protein SCO1/2